MRIVYHEQLATVMVQVYLRRKPESKYCIVLDKGNGKYPTHDTCHVHFSRKGCGVEKFLSASTRQEAFRNLTTIEREKVKEILFLLKLAQL